MQCEIRVRGHLDPMWGHRLAGLRIAHEASGCSLLVGPLPDQAALHGVLLQIVRLGLPLLSLHTSEAPPTGKTGGEGGTEAADGDSARTPRPHGEDALPYGPRRGRHERDGEQRRQNRRNLPPKEDDMVTDSTDARDERQAVMPNPALRHLAPLIGTWEVSGPTISGRVTYEWMEGGFFLVQHLDLIHDGRQIKGIEVIGRIHTLGEEPSKEIWSRVYSALDGLTLDYVYELVADALTIWGGFVGSPARYKGTFSDDRTALVGAWEWPGGGYEATMTRAEGE